MEAQTKNEIVAEIIATAVKKNSADRRESLKRVPPEYFVGKITGEAVEQIKSSTVLDLKTKGNKIRYEANNSIMEKIDKAISEIEKGKR